MLSSTAKGKDEENQHLIKDEVEDDDDPIIFVWMKDQFFQFLSKKERPLLLSRILKYLLIERCLLNSDIGIVINTYTYVRKPPTIDNLPIDTFAFFLIFFLFKLISAISFIQFMNGVRKIQEDRGIARVCSLEMFDAIDLTNNYTFYTLMMIYLNMLYDLYVLICLQCNFVSCSHVIHESSNDSPVVGLDHSILINFALILLFPILYCLILFICCCKKKKVNKKVDVATQTD